MCMSSFAVLSNTILAVCRQRIDRNPGGIHAMSVGQSRRLPKLSEPYGWGAEAFIDWIFSARTDDTKVERIARTLDKLEQARLP